MHQRSAAYGRPSGTDGSDFSFCMVVDSRYKKVTQYKNCLSVMLAVQTVVQLLVSLLTAPIKWQLDEFSFSSGLVCLISTAVGEFGRRRSRVNMLKFYIYGSSLASLVTIATLARNNYFLQVIKELSTWDTSTVELSKTVAMLLGMLIQVVTISITRSLMYNMAPPKRTA